MAPRVRVHETTAPTGAAEHMVAAAVQAHEVVDDRGRTISLRKPNALAQFRLAKTLGPELAANQTYMQMCFPLLFITSIDGEPVSFPSSDREIEGLIQRLDEDGLEAAMKGIEAHWGKVLPTAQDDIKN